MENLNLENTTELNTVETGGLGSGLIPVAIGGALFVGGIVVDKVWNKFKPIQKLKAKAQAKKEEKAIVKLTQPRQSAETNQKGQTNNPAQGSKQFGRNKRKGNVTGKGQQRNYPQKKSNRGNEGNINVPNAERSTWEYVVRTRNFDKLAISLDKRKFYSDL